MPLLPFAFLAALDGVTEALCVSRSGHALVARFWLDPGASPLFLPSGLHVGSALALTLTARRRLSGALTEGLRAIARPGLLRASLGARDALALVVGIPVSLLVGAATRPHVAPWVASPTAAGVGLCVTGLALASTAFASFASGPCKFRLSVVLALAALVGVAHGLAVYPGASPNGAALTVLLWIGVKPHRAVDLCFLGSVPPLLVAGFRDAHDRPTTSAALVGLTLAFLGTLAGASLLRALLARWHLALLALWIIPLGLATLAYAHALPHSG